MTLNGLRIGDLVEVDVKGDVFIGRVEDRIGKGVMVASFSKGRGSRIVTARQVVGRYRKTAGSR